MVKKSTTHFMCYAREDSKWVTELAKDLRAVGAQLWMDQLDIRGGEIWENAIEKALEDCGRLVVVLSPSAVESKEVRAELAYAMDEQKEIIPALYRVCKIPYRLRRLQYVDFTSDYADGLNRLVAAMGITRTRATAHQPFSERLKPRLPIKPVTREVHEWVPGHFDRRGQWNQGYWRPKAKKPNE